MISASFRSSSSNRLKVRKPRTISEVRAAPVSMSQYLVLPSRQSTVLLQGVDILHRRIILEAERYASSTSSGQQVTSWRDIAADEVQRIIDLMGYTGCELTQ